jgi:hypothetical protein
MEQVGTDWNSPASALSASEHVVVHGKIPADPSWLPSCIMVPRVLRLATLLVFAFAGCTGSPVPEPPNLEPPALDRVTATPGSSGSTVVSGTAGAVAPGTMIWGANLETNDPPSITPAGADGSFVLPLAWADGDEIRLQVRDTDDNRSRPVDVIVPGIIEPVRPLAGCLTLDPPLELDLGTTSVAAPETGAVAIDNGCGSTVTIVAVRSRSGSTAFETSVAAPFDVADGASATVDVTFRPATTGPEEEILFLEVSAPSTERRPVTVIGIAR